jgi:hypothetical protein
MCKWRKREKGWTMLTENYEKNNDKSDEITND